MVSAPVYEPEGGQFESTYEHSFVKYISSLLHVKTSSPKRMALGWFELPAFWSVDRRASH